MKRIKSKRTLLGNFAPLRLADSTAVRTIQTRANRYFDTWGAVNALMCPKFAHDLKLMDKIAAYFTGILKKRIHG